MLRRWVWVVVGALVGLVALSLALGQLTSEPVRHSISQPGNVVVVGVPEAKWSQITSTKQPGVWSLLEVGATGSVSPRATKSPTCSPDAWLSLGAAAGADANCKLPPARASGSGVQVPGWAALRQQDRRAEPGLVAATLAGKKQCVTAVGRGAMLAAADKNGRVARYFATPSQQAFAACPVTFVDGSTASGGPPASIETVLQRVFTNLTANTTVLITGLSDGNDQTTAPRLLLAVGPGVKRGELASAATRQPGFVTAADVSGFLLSRAGPQPSAATGATLTVRPHTKSAATVAVDRRRAELKLTRAQALSVPYAITVGALALLLAAWGGWRWRASGRPPSWLAPAGVALGALPVASWLASLLPWWRGGPTIVWFALALLGAVALVVSVAYAGPWREWAPGPPLVVAAITAAVLALDVLNGSRMQLLAPQGLQPLLGGRYYGMGNAGFGFFATAALLLGGLVACRLLWWDDSDETDQRLAAATVGVTGLAAAVIDGWPGWGADFGGPPAILVATGVTVALILGLRLTVRRVAVVIAAALAFVAVAVLIDWRRAPESRTHLGRFVQQVADGDGLGVIGDKLGANVALLFSSPVAPLVPIVLVLAWVAVLRPEHPLGKPLAWLWVELPVLRWVCVGLLVCWSIALCLNDSGVGVPATGAQLAIPLLVALAVPTRRSSDA